VKVDGANRSVILNSDGAVRDRIHKALSKENGMEVRKLAWLSNKDNGKAYSSMVVYLTRSTDVSLLLQKRYFHVAGESAYTKAFEPRQAPNQCYNCQEIGHKAFQCKSDQVCDNCAGKGHHHRECLVDLKCTLCSGLHKSFSRNCRKLYPPQNE
jgi:hypothetical protein